jgi:hypothetical protein
MARSVLRRRRGEAGTVELGPNRTAVSAPPDSVVVCASGNLALVYLTGVDGRATAEEVEDRHPGLIERLATHPGIGVLLVRSEGRGALAIGPAGVHLLDEGQVQGSDPLVRYGPLTADRLRRIDGFSNVGDLVIISRFDEATEEVAAFEELIGSHGGLGGPQTEAFLIVPADWATPEAPVVGSVAVNELLHGWIAAERDAAAAAEAGPVDTPAPPDTPPDAPTPAEPERVAAFGAVPRAD